MSTKSMFPNQLDGKVVLIVGGSSGIGLSAAIQAKEAGAQVIIVGSNSERTEKVATENGFKGWRAADVARPNDIQSALKDIQHVDHLVMSAGSFIMGKVLEAEISTLSRIFDERIWAAVHVLRTLGNKLAPDASVTFFSGEVVDRPNPYGVALFAAALSAMETLARGLAVEMAPRRFNTIAPGPINTPLLVKAMGDSSKGYIETRSQTLPLKRFGTAEEVGGVAIFLMVNKWMNGETIHADGGSRYV
jgi:NAD(P)-dependent dehydrogenase (short-subunit alcohol dehydrogenase family)